MPHCTRCGAVVADQAAFCPQCGQAQGTAATPTTRSGLSENAAATLSYVLGWLTGLIFFLIDKRPYVRFHAAQSLVLFGGLHVIRMVLGIFWGMHWFIGGWDWHSFGLGAAVTGLLGLLTLVLWVLCMVKASQGERFRVPIAADLADNIAK